MNKKIYIEFFKPYLFKYVILFSTVVFSTIISIYQPIIIKNMFDSSIDPYEAENQITNIILLIIVFLIGQLVFYIQSIIATKIGEGVLFDIRKKAFNSIIYKPINFFSIHRTGESMNMLLSEVNTIVNFILGTSLVISSNIISIVLSISIIIILDFYIAISVIAASLVYLILVKKQSITIRHFERKVLDSQIKLSNASNEMLSSIKTVKYLKIYDFIIKRFSNPSIEYYNTKVEYVYIHSKMRILLTCVTFIPTIILMTYGMQRVVKGYISIGTVFAISNLLNIYIGSIKQLQNINKDYQKFLIKANRLTSILDDLNVLKFNEIKISDKFEINIKNLYFNYEDKNILRGLNCNFKAGDLIHVKGENGSGKTSLINLLSGLICPGKGEIYFDNVDISNISPNIFKEIIGVVPQQIHLFSGTIKENILVGRNCKENEIINLIKKLRFTDIEKIINDDIEEKGNNLSEGQKQKIAILRALILNPYILILDEASSSLDKESKENLYKYLTEHKFNKIIFVITHDYDIKSSRILDLDKHSLSTAL